MKNPLELNNGSTLKYKKSLFSIRDVLNEKYHMGTPEAWLVSEDTKNYYLLFSEKRYDVIHADLQHLPFSISSGMEGRYAHSDKAKIDRFLRTKKDIGNPKKNLHKLFIRTRLNTQYYPRYIRI